MVMARREGVLGPRGFSRGRRRRSSRKWAESCSFGPNLGNSSSLQSREGPGADLGGESALGPRYFSRPLSIAETKTAPVPGAVSSDANEAYASEMISGKRSFPL